MPVHSPANQPREVAPLVVQFGGQASRAAALVRLHPALAQCIALAPRRALHAYGALLQQHAADGITLERTADVLLGDHPRALLRAAVPDPHERLFRVLDRAALPAWPLAAYRLLNTVLNSDMADLLALDCVSDLRPPEVERLAALLTADPVVKRARRLTHASRYRNGLVSVVALLRAYNALHDLEALPDGAGARAIARRVKADLARLRMPDPSLPEPEGWTRLSTVGDLWTYATRMQLCIAPGHYGAGTATINALMGQSVFLHSVEHNALAELRAVPNRAWVIVEAAVARNGRLLPRVTDSLRDGLVALGVVLLPVTPHDAIDIIFRTFKDGRRPDGNGIADIGDAGEDDEEDKAEAA